MAQTVNTTEMTVLEAFAQVRQQVVALCDQRRYAAAQLYLVGSGFDAEDQPGLWEYVARRATADGTDPISHKIRTTLWSKGLRSADLAIEEARHFLDSGDPDSAGFILESVFGQVPTDRDARHLMAATLMRRAESRQDRTAPRTDREAALRLAAELDDGSIEETMTVADLLRYSGELAKARDLVATARHRFPDEMRLVTRAARIEEQAGDLEAAMAHWSHIAGHSERYRVEALFRLYELNERMERPAELEAIAVDLLAAELTLPERMRLAFITGRPEAAHSLARIAASGGSEGGQISFEEGKAMGALLLDNGDIGLLAWLRRMRVPLGDNVKSALTSCGFGIRPDRPVPGSFAEAVQLRSPDFMVPLEDFLDLDPKPAGWPGVGKRPDRILLVNRALSAGGAERQFIELVRALQSAGYAGDRLHVALFSIAQDRGHAHFLPELQAMDVTIHDLGTREVTNPTIPAMVSAATEALPRGLRNDVRALWHLISDIQPQGLHGWQDRSAAACGLVGLLTSIERVVLSFRNMSPRTRRDRQLIMLKALFADYARRENVVITTNAIAAAQDYANWMDTDVTRIGLLSNAVDVARFHPGIAADRRSEISAERPLRIGGIFRLALNKRPELWLRIVAALRHTHGIDLSAKIFGRGPLEDKLRDLANDLGIGDLTLAGNATTPEELYGDMDMLLLASRVEGLPNVLLEAQACGIPVAACNVGGVKDALLLNGASAGLLLEPDCSPETAAESIALWLPGALKAPSANRVKFIEQHFSTRAFARSAMLAYEGRISESGHP